jgi:hypothetical protein
LGIDPAAFYHSRLSSSLKHYKAVRALYVRVVAFHDMDAVYRIRWFAPVDLVGIAGIDPVAESQAVLRARSSPRPSPARSDAVEAAD